MLWWIPAGSLPTLQEAGERLMLLDKVGPGPEAFTLREPYPTPSAPGGGDRAAVGGE